jgi:predicted transcriptional regulator
VNQNVLASDLMSRPVLRLTLRTRIHEAADFLLRHGITGAPVEDEHGRWKGVFSMNDVARAVAERLGRSHATRTLEARESSAPETTLTLDGLGDVQVGELMTLGMVTVFPVATLAEVVRSLLSSKIHRVFVIREEDNQLEGVITTMDVMRWLDGSGRERNVTRELGRIP